MSLKTIGSLYDIIVGADIVKVQLVGDGKASGLELTYADDRVEQFLFTKITVQEPKEELQEEPPKGKDGA